MSEQFVGEIRMFAGNYAPQDWALCNGAQLNIAQNQPLFSLIGTTYGGDGVNTFNLPDLRGRLPIGQGQGAGLTNRIIGQTTGAEQVQISLANYPAHTHAFNAWSGATNTTAVAGAYLGNVSAITISGTPVTAFQAASTPTLTTVALATDAVSIAPGGNQPHTNMMPFMVINFIIALQGLYPPRP